MPATAEQRVGAVVIPLKSFTKAKERLAPAMSPTAREALARSTAERVIQAALRLPQVTYVLVVADDQTGADWATAIGAHAIVESGGLNPSVTAGYQAASDAASWVMVCHADLVHAERLSALAHPGPSQAIIVRDRHRSGTNVLALPAGRDFTFHYGPDSAPQHHAECIKCGLDPIEVDDALLAVDIDTPDDLRLIPDWLRTELDLST